MYSSSPASAVWGLAIAWTAAVLTPANREWLAALPAGPRTIDDVVEICHGSPFDEDVYIFDDLDARRAIRVSRRPVCLFGHTHVPAVFRFDRVESDLAEHLEHQEPHDRIVVRNEDDTALGRFGYGHVNVPSLGWH